jgi:hypothetical protein
MRLMFAEAEMHPSGTRAATHSAPICPFPRPMISMTQASFGSAMAIVSPPLA